MQLKEKINKIDWKKQGSLLNLLAKDKKYFTPLKEKEFNTDDKQNEKDFSSDERQKSVKKH